MKMDKESRITKKREKRIASDPREMTPDDLAREVYSLRKELANARSTLKIKCIIIEQMEKTHYEKVAQVLLDSMTRAGHLRR